MLLPIKSDSESSSVGGSRPDCPGYSKAGKWLHLLPNRESQVSGQVVTGCMGKDIAFIHYCC